MGAGSVACAESASGRFLPEKTAATAVAANNKAWARESGGRGVVCKRLSLKEICQSVA
jgi:hypothetical protein